MTEEEKIETTEKSGSSGLNVPFSIIIAGLIVAGAILVTGQGFSGSDNEAAVGANDNNPVVGQTPPKTPVVSKKDHILGDPNAPIKIVEFSDLDCSFCRSFHEPMKDIIEEYGEEGKVAWVYRHFPLESIHPMARAKAHATECAAELGGKSAFWEYTDVLFLETPDIRTNSQALSNIATRIGINKASFEKCQESGKYNEKIDDHIDSALESGARGTPYSVLIGDDIAIPISGAQSFEQLKSYIESAL